MYIPNIEEKSSDKMNYPKINVILNLPEFDSTLFASSSCIISINPAFVFKRFDPITHPM